MTNSNSTRGDDTSTTTSGNGEIDVESPAFLAKIDQLAMSCLRNVHIFRPQDTVSTIVLLRTLDTYLLQQTNTTAPSSLSTTTSQLQSQSHQQQQQQPSPPFAFLILDSLSTFYWQDRAQTNHTRIMSLLYDGLQRLVARWGLIFITTSWLLDSSSSSSSAATSAFANIADRTIPDSLRAKIRYRFLLQPRNLNRFETEQLLLQEWQFRQQQQQQQQQGGKQDDVAQSGREEEGNPVGVLGAGNKYLSHEPDPIETRPSLFQGQMIIPETQHEPHTQPELFRFSISMKEGLFSFCPPAPAPPLPPLTPQNM